jgi:hypothetical protein
MSYTLAELDRRWGGTSAYLRSIGVPELVEEAVRRNLLDKGAP